MLPAGKLNQLLPQLRNRVQKFMAPSTMKWELIKAKLKSHVQDNHVVIKKFANLKRFEHSQVDRRLGELNRMMNRITGYDVCERLRERVKTQDLAFESLRTQLHEARQNFSKAVQERSQAQKELNNLLQRKQLWKDDELVRFTELYRQEIRLEHEETRAKLENDQLEVAVDKAHQQLMTTMRERYQEEQLWSDKIRRASTFGTLALMLVNLGLFLFLQLVLEPRKRLGFVRQFEHIFESKIDSLNASILAANTAGSESISKSVATDRDFSADYPDIPQILPRQDNWIARLNPSIPAVQGVALGTLSVLLFLLLARPLSR